MIFFIVPCSMLHQFVMVKAAHALAVGYFEKARNDEHMDCTRSVPLSGCTLIKEHREQEHIGGNRFG
jgi:hypothetical protein